MEQIERYQTRLLPVIRFQCCRLTFYPFYRTYGADRTYTVITPVFLPLKSRSNRYKTGPGNVREYRCIRNIRTHSRAHSREGNKRRSASRFAYLRTSFCVATLRLRGEARRGEASRRDATPFQCRSIYPSGSRRQSRARRVFLF